MSFELAFVLGALAFYLYDCLCLLYDDEYLFVKAPAGWQAAADWNLIVLRRRLYLLNPFLPQQPTFRVVLPAGEVPVEGAEFDSAADPEPFVRALRPVQLISALQGALLILALPVTLLLAGTGWQALCVVVAFYLLSVASLLWAGRQRRRYGLDGKALVSLWSDALLCAPFAVNTARKICLRRGLGLPAGRFAQRHFTPASRAQFCASVAARLSARIAAEPDDSPARSALERQLTLIRKLAE